MVKVKIQEDLYVERTGVQYTKGQEVEVSNDLAKRHIETGIFKEVTAAKPKPKQAPVPQDTPPVKEIAPSGETK